MPPKTTEDGPRCAPDKWLKGLARESPSVLRGAISNGTFDDETTVCAVDALKAADRVRAESA